MNKIQIRCETSFTRSIKMNDTRTRQQYTYIVYTIIDSIPTNFNFFFLLRYVDGVVSHCSLCFVLIAFGMESQFCCNCKCVCILIFSATTNNKIKCTVKIATYWVSSSLFHFSLLESFSVHCVRYEWLATDLYAPIVICSKPITEKRMPRSLRLNTLYTITLYI